MDFASNNEPIIITEEIPYRRQIWMTIILSAVYPALPFLYNGEFDAAIFVAIGLTLLYFGAQFLFRISFTAFTATMITLAIVYLGFLLYNVIHTIKTNRLDKPRLKDEWVLILIFTLAALGVSHLGNLLTSRFLVGDYSTPSSSMAKTLIPGDFLVADKGINIANLKRDQVIIFKYPVDPSQTYIKRLIAVGRDKVKIVDKRLYINNKRVPLPEGGQLADSLRILPHSDLGSWHSSNDKTKFWISSGNRDNMPETVIPQGMLFVMGDNRDNSSDSRYWGLLDSDLVIGRAKYIYFSWDPVSYHIRWDRIGKRLG
jgi:signal peptidase I